MTGTNSSSALAAYYGQKSDRLTDSAVEVALQFVGQDAKPMSEAEGEDACYFCACGERDRAKVEQGGANG